MTMWNRTAHVAALAAMIAMPAARGPAGRAAADRPASSAAATTSVWMRVGTPDLQSADALAFAPDGTLIVGDSSTASLFAFAVADAAAPASVTKNLLDIDRKVAARLGTSAGEIVVNDMAVHPRSRALYLAITRGRGRARTPVIVRVSATAVDAVPLTRTPFARVTLPNPPAAGQMTEDNDPALEFSITGLRVVDGQVYVAGMTNQEFSSTLRRVPLPFAGTGASTSIRIYHTHHSRYETRSPITAFVPAMIGGRAHVIASYGCTPVVILPMDALADGAQVTGTTIAELGAGTHAVDMIEYGYQGHRYLAIASARRSLQLISMDDVERAPGMDDKNPGEHPPATDTLRAFRSWGAKAAIGDQMGILQLADFDDDYAVALQRDTDTGALNLNWWKKPILHEGPK